MHEIEAKIKVKDLKVIARKLGRIGAKFLHTAKEQDLYFNSADGKLLKSNCGLRLRKRKFTHKKMRPQIFLTWKGPTGKSAFKSRPEIQVEVADYDMLKKILLSLEYRKHLSVNKIRQIWTLGKCEICLDKVQKLGTFIEVEGPSEKAIISILKKLSLDHSKHISSGYARMLANKR